MVRGDLPGCKEGKLHGCDREITLNIGGESTLRKIRESILRITAEDYRREAVGFEGRAAHGSGVGAEIRGWRRPGVIEKPSSLRLKTLFGEQIEVFTHRGLQAGGGSDTLTVSETNCLECGVLNNICSVALNKAVPSPARTNNRQIIARMSLDE